MRDHLDSDYRFCKRVTQKNSKSFYAAFSRLPKNKAKAVYAVYAFCRAVDDAVDIETDIEKAKQKLTVIRQRLDEVYEGIIPQERGWSAFSDTVKEWKIPKDPFEDQIQGQLLDLDFKPLSNLKELYQYCDYVAGSVGRMLLPILATENRAVLMGQVSSIGIAMQLTNILRDIGEDLRDRDRIYLPQDRMDYYQIQVQNLKKGIIDDYFISLWEELAKGAEALYEEGLQLILQFDKDSIEPVFFSILIYRGIHQAVRQNNYDCLSTRNFVTKKEMKQMIIEGKNDLKKRRVVSNE